MTDRDIILKTIIFLRDKGQHIDVEDLVWKEFELSPETKLRIRDILLTGELINLGDGTFNFKPTAKCLIAKPQHIDKNGYYVSPQERFQKCILLLGLFPVAYALFECIKDVYQFYLWINCCHCH